MSGGAAAWAAARRVLAVRLDAMGDVLMTAPALAALKDGGTVGEGGRRAGDGPRRGDGRGSGRHRGGPVPRGRGAERAGARFGPCVRPAPRHVTLLTSPAGAAAAALIPAVDAVLAHRAPWAKPPPGHAPDPAADLALVEILRAGAFDAAAIFTVHSQSALPAALLCHLAGIPLRLACCRENPYGLLTDWVRETEPAARLRHEARRQIDLVAAVGLRGPEAPGLVLPSGAVRAAAARLAVLGFGAGVPWCVVHPGASAPSRRAPPETLAEVVRRLAGEHGWRVLVSGGEGEGALAARVAEAPGAVALGPMPLAELAALIARAPVLVTGNTGPAHLAAALGTPVVDLYALTNLQHAPWRGRGRVLFQDVPCRVCLKSVCPEGHHRCLAGVPASAIVAAAREAAAGRGPAIPEDPAALFGRAGLWRGADEARDLSAAAP